MMALFAYGTLMSEEIVKAVIGFVPERKQGTITGFRRYAVKNADYPGIMQARNFSVAGIVYLDIDRQSWNRLDLFEGEMYYRQLVGVQADDETVIEAETYVVKPSYFSSLTEHDWSFARFKKSGKASFVASYNGFEHLKE